MRPASCSPWTLLSLPAHPGWMSEVRAQPASPAEATIENSRWGVGRGEEPLEELSLIKEPWAGNHESGLMPGALFVRRAAELDEVICAALPWQVSRGGEACGSHTTRLYHLSCVVWGKFPSHCLPCFSLVRWETNSLCC